MKKALVTKALVTKALVTFGLLALVISAGAMDFNSKTLSGNQIQIIQQSIYKLEGGNDTQYPYGIRSINTHGNKQLAAKICKTTIINNYVRWQRSDKSKDYLTFLADVYCPKSADPTGNKNWIRNIHVLVK